MIASFQGAVLYPICMGSDVALRRQRRRDGDCIRHVRYRGAPSGNRCSANRRRIAAARHHPCNGHLRHTCVQLLGNGPQPLDQRQVGAQVFALEARAVQAAVNFFSSLTGRDLEWEYEEGGQTHQVAMRSYVSVGSTEAYLAGCCAGLGLIQAPRMGLEPLFESGALVEVLPHWRPAPMPVSVVYSHNRQLSPRVRVFVDWLARELTIR